MQRFRDPQGEIHVACDEEFVIELSGNPTTGYTWQVEVPESLELVDRRFEPADAALGSGGRQVFHFRSRQTGAFDLEFTYRRPWTATVREIRRIRVVVSAPAS